MFLVWENISMFFSNLHFSVDLSVDFEGLKRSNDNVIIIGTLAEITELFLVKYNIKIFFLTSSHLLCKECDHLGKVNWSGSLADQVVGLCVCDGSPNVDKGGLEVRGCDDAILVNINDAKGFLELLDLLLAEECEDVGTRLLRLL